MAMSTSIVIDRGGNLNLYLPTLNFTLVSPLYRHATSHPRLSFFFSLPLYFFLYSSNYTCTQKKDSLHGTEAIRSACIHSMHVHVHDYAVFVYARTCIGFRYELSLVLNGVSPIPNVTHLEEKIVQEFSNTPTVTRATNPHTSTTVTCSGLTSSRYHIRDNFNYLLLDPPELASCPPANDLIGFKTFVESIFYIGKGKNSRPIQHLKDAKSALIKAEKVSTACKLDYSISLSFHLAQLKTQTHLQHLEPWQWCYISADVSQHY